MTFQSSVIVGYNIPSSVVYSATDNSTSIRGCSHSDNNTKFCPECGKPTWIHTPDTRCIPDIIKTLQVPTCEFQFAYIYSNAAGPITQRERYNGLLIGKVTTTPIQSELVQVCPYLTDDELRNLHDIFRSIGIDPSLASMGVWFVHPSCMYDSVRVIFAR